MHAIPTNPNVLTSLELNIMSKFVVVVDQMPNSMDLLHLIVSFWNNMNAKFAV